MGFEVERALEPRPLDTDLLDARLRRGVPESAREPGGGADEDDRDGEQRERERHRGDARGDGGKRGVAGAPAKPLEVVPRDP